MQPALSPIRFLLSPGSQDLISHLRLVTIASIVRYIGQKLDCDSIWHSYCDLGTVEEIDVLRECDGNSVDISTSLHFIKQSPVP